MNVRQSEPLASHDKSGLPKPRRYWSAAAIWLALAMAVLDGAIANVALPTIAKDLGASAATSVWIVNAYQLTITVLRRIYIPGLAIFTFGSLGCAMAHGLMTLILARVLQGVGAACIMSMNAALVRATYPHSMLGRGIGYNAMVLSMSAAAGPTLAAIILSIGNWPWLFLINLPIGLAAIAVGLRALPEAGGHGRSVDWLSALLSMAMMGCAVFGIETATRVSVTMGLGLITVGIVSGAMLVAANGGIQRHSFQWTSSKFAFSGCPSLLRPYLSPRKCSPS